jgi:2-oxoisovalerate dehydrogenase E1 component alpha subunit
VDTVRQLKDEAKAEANEAVVKATAEPKPTKDDVLKFSYAPSEVDAVYPEDYTGLPGKR